MSGSNEKDKYLLGTVNNALKLMDLLSLRNEMSMTEISRTLELDKTAVFRLLYTLERRDYVYKNEQGKYCLGLKFTNYGNIVAERQNIIEIARPYMRSCCAKHEISVHLGILNSHGRVVTMHKEEPTSGFFFTARIGSSMPAYCAAMGKVILANKEPAEKDAIIKQLKFKKYSDATIANVKDLREHLNVVKEQGWAIDTNECVLGFSCLAAPIRDYKNQCIAAVGIVATEAIMAENLDNYRTWIQELAAEVSNSFQ